MRLAASFAGERLWQFLQPAMGKGAVNLIKYMYV
jgi:hypothetical protein